MPLSKWEAQDQITEVGTKEAEESPLIADMPTPTTPVTQARSNQKLRLFLKLKTKKKRKTCSLPTENPRSSFCFDFRPSGKKCVESPSLQSEGKTSSNRYKRKWILCLVRPSWSRFLGRRRQIRSSQRVVHSCHKRVGQKSGIR